MDHRSVQVCSAKWAGSAAPGKRRDDGGPALIRPLNDYPEILNKRLPWKVADLLAAQSAIRSSDNRLGRFGRIDRCA